jgi:hypothetical protein
LDAYSEGNLEFLEQVGKQVAVAVDNVLHHQDLTRERDPRTGRARSYSEGPPRLRLGHRRPGWSRSQTGHEAHHPPIQDAEARHHPLQVAPIFRHAPKLRQSHVIRSGLVFSRWQ